MTAVKKQSTKAELPAAVTVAKAPQAPKPETPKAPTPTTPPQPPSANKQRGTVARLKAAWTEKGVDLSKLEEKVDGKYILLRLPNFPECKVGPSGGLEVALPSYPIAFEAALNGDTLLAKLQARHAKKQSAPTPPAQAAKPQPPASPVRPESPTQKKARKDAALEASLA